MNDSIYATSRLLSQLPRSLSQLPRHANFAGIIDNRLTLMDHLYRIPGCQEEAVDPGPGGRKGSSIIEIQKDGVLAVLAPCVDLRAIA